MFLSWTLIFGLNEGKLQIQFGFGWVAPCQEMGDNLLTSGEGARLTVS